MVGLKDIHLFLDPHRDKWFYGPSTIFQSFGFEVIKPLLCSTQLSMKSKVLINIEIFRIKGSFMLSYLSMKFILLINVLLQTC